MTLDLNIEDYINKINLYKNKTKAALHFGKDAQNMDQYLRGRGKKIKKEILVLDLAGKPVNLMTIKKKDSDLYKIVLSVQKAGQITQGCLPFGLSDLSFKYRLKKSGYQLSYVFKLVDI